MATIKGQDLRLYLEGKAIACATNCALHCSAETSDESTKDDEDGVWAHNGVTKLSWDISGEGLATLGIVESGLAAGATAHSIAHGEYTCYRYEKPFTLTKGQTINLKTNNAAYKYLIIADGSENTLAEGGNSISYTATGTITVYAYIGAHDAPTANYEVLDKTRYNLDDLLDMIEAKTALECHFRTGGGNVSVVEGDVILTDVQIQAQNGNTATYSFQAQGQGELSIG